jgi:hypothetical protein
MFVKEMENAEKQKKYYLRTLFCCGFCIKDKIIDPRKLSTFVEDVMDPYGRQDKILEEIKKIEGENNKNTKKRESKLNEKVLSEMKNTTKILKNNTSLVEQLYNKLECGELYNNEPKHINEQKKRNGFYKHPNVVTLFGDNDVHKKPLFHNINLEIDDIQEFGSDNEERKSKNSDSSNSLMDIDVVCEQNNTNL